MDEVSLGQYALPVLVTTFLGFFFKICEREDGSSCVPSRYKPIVAVCLGIVFGMLAMIYKSMAPSFPVVIDHLLYGFMAGAAAVGLWEISTKPRGK